MHFSTGESACLLPAALASAAGYCNCWVLPARCHAVQPSGLHAGRRGAGGAAQGHVCACGRAGAGHNVPPHPGCAHAAPGGWARGIGSCVHGCQAGRSHLCSYAKEAGCRGHARPVYSPPQPVERRGGGHGATLPPTLFCPPHQAPPPRPDRPPSALQVSDDGARDYRLVVQRHYESEPSLTMGRFRPKGRCACSKRVVSPTPLCACLCLHTFGAQRSCSCWSPVCSWCRRAWGMLHDTPAGAARMAAATPSFQGLSSRCACGA